MKHFKIIVLFLVLILMNCQSNKRKDNSIHNQLKSKVETIKIEDFSIALDFINDYISAEGSLDISNDKRLTTSFKKYHQDIISKSEKENSEYGLGFDPIIDGQDNPENFVIKQADSTSGFLTVRGLKWKEFEVVMRVVKLNDVYLVDGCGIINIPKEKQAKR